MKIRPIKNVGSGTTKNGNRETEEQQMESLSCRGEADACSRFLKNEESRMMAYPTVKCGGQACPPYTTVRMNSWRWSRRGY
jgi:hypothetical protein